MRKLLIILIMFISLFLCYYVVTNGLTIGEFKIANYKEISVASRQIDTSISQLVNLNENGFKEKRAEIANTITAYKNQKELYESMKTATMTPIADLEQEMGMVDMYDIDFLWTIIGSYGTEEGINLRMDCVKSTVIPEIEGSEYTMCDLRFTVSGDYIAITEFIYDIEDDNRLGFEISNFEMMKGGENLQATFIIRGVPVNNRNLTQLQVSLDSNANANAGAATTDNNANSGTIQEATGDALQATGAALSSGKLRDTSTANTADTTDATAFATDGT